MEGLLNRTITFFFPNNTAYEVACEAHDTCTTDMLSFKGYLHRWMATTAQLAPYTHDSIMAVLRTSTQAAINQCTGGDSGRACGFQWSSGVFDDSVGAGQTMNVLGAVSSLLIDEVRGPLTNSTGGTSAGDYNAGSSSDDDLTEFAPITTGDRVGAGFLTAFVLACIAGLFGYMSFGD